MTVQSPPINNPNTLQQVLLLSQTIFEMLKGRDNSVGTFTLNAGATETTVTDNLFNSDMVPLWVPTTANAATAMTNLRVTTRNNGSFVLTHSNTADADKTFLYSRRG